MRIPGSALPAVTCSCSLALSGLGAMGNSSGGVVPSAELAQLRLPQSLSVLHFPFLVPVPAQLWGAPDAGGALGLHRVGLSSLSIITVPKKSLRPPGFLCPPDGAPVG